MIYRIKYRRSASNCYNHLHNHTFLMFEQIFLTTPMKRNVIISKNWYILFVNDCGSITVTEFESYSQLTFYISLLPPLVRGNSGQSPSSGAILIFEIYFTKLIRNVQWNLLVYTIIILSKGFSNLYKKLTRVRFKPTIFC